MPPQRHCEMVRSVSAATVAVSRPTRPVPGSSKDQNIVDKKFNDNGHMITIGVNFHF